MRRIGISQRVENLEDRQERRDCLDQAWTTLLFQNRFIPIPLPNLWNRDHSIIEEFGLDGIILTGGNDLSSVKVGKNIAPERDEFESYLIEHAIRIKLPLLGVCRGMQLIANHFSSQIMPLENHIGRHIIQVTDTEFITGSSKKIEVNSFHNFAIKSIPEDFMICARSEDGSVEAMRHLNLPIYAIMWHPERVPTLTINDNILKRVFGGN